MATLLEELQIWIRYPENMSYIAGVEDDILTKLVAKLAKSKPPFLTGELVTLWALSIYASLMVLGS